MPADRRVAPIGEIAMPVFHIDHKLADFDKWIEVFKEGNPRKEMEAKHGVKSMRVLHDANDRNHAIVVMEADSSAAIEALFSQPQVQERFADRSLFAEAPTILAGYDGTDLDSRPDGEHSAFFVDHRLADYDKWYAEYSSHQPQNSELREKHGVKHIRLLHDIGDNNHAIIVMIAPDQSAIENLMKEAGLDEIFANREIFQQPPEITGQFSAIVL